MNREMKMLKIKPVDSLYLGSGKSFTKGQSSWHQSKLIPYPAVVYGAICSAMLEQNPRRKRLYMERGDSQSDPRKYLELGAVYLYEQKRTQLNASLYMAAPRDLFVDTYGNLHYGIFSSLPTEVVTSLQGVTYYMKNPVQEEIDRVDGMFLKWHSFISAYYQTADTLALSRFDDIANYTYKVGIERDASMRSKEGHLYRLDLMDFKDGNWSYLVEYRIDGEWWDKSDQCLARGFLKMGGENKSCLYEEMDAPGWQQEYARTMQRMNNSEYVKLVLTTPAIFSENGWRPDFGSNVEVVAAVTAKPYSIGGFDMVLKKPKPMWKAAPEGSVYLLKSSDFVGKSCGEIKKQLVDTQHFMSRDGYGRFEIVPLHNKQMEGNA